MYRSCCPLGLQNTITKMSCMSNKLNRIPCRFEFILLQHCLSLLHPWLLLFFLYPHWGVRACFRLAFYFRALILSYVASHPALLALSIVPHNSARSIQCSSSELGSLPNPGISLTFLLFQTQLNRVGSNNLTSHHHLNLLKEQKKY